MWELAFAALQ